jgi:hypothetical protein
MKCVTISSTGEDAFFSFVLQHLISMHSSSIIRLINDWLQNEHVILSDDLLTKIKDFVSRVTAGAYRPDGIVLHILRGIQDKVCMHIGSILETWLMFDL